jgi:hypothetical protein
LLSDAKIAQKLRFDVVTVKHLLDGIAVGNTTDGGVPPSDENTLTAVGA